MKITHPSGHIPCIITIGGLLISPKVEKAKEEKPKAAKPKTEKLKEEKPKTAKKSTKKTIVVETTPVETEVKIIETTPVETETKIVKEAPAKIVLPVLSHKGFMVIDRMPIEEEERTKVYRFIKDKGHEYELFKRQDFYDAIEGTEYEDSKPFGDNEYEYVEGTSLEKEEDIREYARKSTEWTLLIVIRGGSHCLLKAFSYLTA